jgi:hypothetical protein
VQVPHCFWCKAKSWTRRHIQIVRSHREGSEHQPSEVGSFSYWFDKSRFHTEGRLAAVLTITFSWGFELGGHLQYSYINTAPPKVRVDNGSMAPIIGRGSIRCTKTLSLSPVLHVPKVLVNLLSVSSITKSLNFRSWFDPTHCAFQEAKTRRILGARTEHDGLCYLL